MHKETSPLLSNNISTNSKYSIKKRVGICSIILAIFIAMGLFGFQYKDRIISHYSNRQYSKSTKQVQGVRGTKSTRPQRPTNEADETDETDEEDEEDETLEILETPEIDEIDENELDNDNKAPNIIYIILDDLGWADLSMHGAEYDTPDIDDLIENESIFLNSHYVGLLCSASRSQILSGRHAFNMGIQTLDAFAYGTMSTLPSGAPLISNLLKKYGNYDTYMIGKWHLGYVTENSLPLSRGFDYYYGFNGGEIYYYNKTGVFRGSPGEVAINFIDWWENHDIDYTGRDGFSTIQISDKLGEIIDKYEQNALSGEKNDPFYIYAALQAPHTPLAKSPTIEVQEKCSHISNDFERQKFCENVIEIEVLTMKLVEQLKKSESNLWDNTLIVFTSDNGGDLDGSGCNYPYRGSKGQYFEGGVKTFSFLTGGYILDSQYGTIRDSLIHGVDWVPTLLTIAGINIKNDLDEMEYTGLDGYDMSNILLYGDYSDINNFKRNEVPLTIGTIEQDNAILFEYNNNRYKYAFFGEVNQDRSFETGCYYSTENNFKEKIQYKLPYDHKKAEFLFNLDDDKSESNNLLQNNDDKQMIQTILEIAQTKLQKYREHKYFNDYLLCFTTVFGERFPYGDGDAWGPFFDWDEFTQEFLNNCNDEVNDDLKELFLVHYE